MVSKLKQVSSIDSSNKMRVRQQANKVINQQIQQRRKWSDWSQCSESCVKTRHRLNCEDILQAQNATAKPISDVNLIGPKEVKQIEGLKEDEEEEELKIDQTNDEDNDDYADEGDEEGETDTCANVIDTSKTLEEKPCVGGLCRLSGFPTENQWPKDRLAIQSRRRTENPKQKGECLFRWLE